LIIFTDNNRQHRGCAAPVGSPWLSFVTSFFNRVHTRLRIRSQLSSVQLVFHLAFHSLCVSSRVYAISRSAPTPHSSVSSPASYTLHLSSTHPPWLTGRPPIRTIHLILPSHVFKPFPFLTRHFFYFVYGFTPPVRRCRQHFQSIANNCGTTTSPEYCKCVRPHLTTVCLPPRIHPPSFVQVRKERKVSLQTITFTTELKPITHQNECIPASHSTASPTTTKRRPHPNWSMCCFGSRALRFQFPCYCRCPAVPTSIHPISSRAWGFCGGVNRSPVSPPSSVFALFPPPHPDQLRLSTWGAWYVWGNLQAITTTTSATREPPASGMQFE
jgi:hypothetical protein